MSPIGKAVIVVHAGMLPGVPVMEQNRSTMTRIRNILPDGTASADHHYNESVGWPWASRYRAGLIRLIAIRTDVGERSIVLSKGHCSSKRQLFKYPFTIELYSSRV